MEKVCDSELTGYLASDESDDDGEDLMTNMEVTLNVNFHSRKSKYSKDECCSDQDDPCYAFHFPEETNYEQAEPVINIICFRKSHHLSSGDDLFPEETGHEQKETGLEVNKTKPKMDINSDIMWDIHLRKRNYSSSDECSIDQEDLSCDDLFPKETGHEQEVSRTEPEMDTNSKLMLDINFKKNSYMSSDECSCERDDLSCDDLFFGDTVTTSLMGYDATKTKSENRKEDASSEDKLLVDFTGPHSDKPLDYNFKKKSYMSSDECSCDRDDLSCDDLIFGDTVTTTSLMGYDATKTKSENRKEDASSEVKLLVDSTGPQSDKPLDYNFKKKNYMSSDECSCDRDDLSCDDLFFEDTITTSLMGYDTTKTKSENRKEDASSVDKLLVDFAGPQSDKPLKSPLFSLNPKDPLHERSAADAHQEGSRKQNGVQNTLLNEVNVTADDHISLLTSDVSFQTVPKYQLKENLPQIGQETHRLAILRLDLSQVWAADLFGRMCHFLPKGGKIKSVGVYSTEKHMKEDDPVGLFDDKVDERNVMLSPGFEESRRRYYAVVECDSTDTAKFVYKDFTSVFSYIGVTPKMLELRFIPDLMKLDDRLHDIATEEPTTYGGPDLIHLLSAKDLEQIVIVPEHRNPKLLWDASAPRRPQRSKMD